MNSYEVFCLYQAIKLHFSQDSYDFFKYHGKSRITPDAFENRKDKWYFSKLSRKFNERDECIMFLVANMLEDDKAWIGNLLTEQADDINRHRQKVIQSLTYTFENDVTNLLGQVSEPDQMLKVIDGEHPLLLKSLMRKEVQIETVCIMNSLMKFLPMWQKRIEDTIIWPSWQMKIRKYAAFLQVDDVKYRNILKKVIV